MDKADETKKMKYECLDEDSGVVPDYIRQNVDYPICYFIAPLNALIKNDYYSKIPEAVNTTEKVEEFYNNHKSEFSTGGTPSKTKDILTRHFKSFNYLAIVKAHQYYLNDLLQLWHDYRGCISIGLEKEPSKNKHWIFAEALTVVHGVCTLHLKDQVNFAVYTIQITAGQNVIGKQIQRANGTTFGIVTQVGVLFPLPPKPGQE